MRGSSAERRRRREATTSISPSRTTSPRYCKPPSDDRFIININPAQPRLIVSTSSLPDASINQAYTAPALTASGATVSSWTLAGGTLPPGLTLNPNGVISGTPTQSGVFSFTVQANGDGTSDTKQLAIFVLAPLDLGLAPNGTPATTQPLAVSMKLATPFAWGVKATGGREPYTYTADALPAGITLNPDGTVTGTPTRAGVTRSTITVKDVRGTADTLRVTFTTQALLAFHKTKVAKVGKVGKVYSWRLPVAGASETKIFLVSGRIPPGLELDEETGFLTGTPLVRGDLPGQVLGARRLRDTGLEDLSHQDPGRAAHRREPPLTHAGSRPPGPVSGRARMPPWTRFAVSSSSPGPGSTTRTSGGR